MERQVNAWWRSYQKTSEGKEDGLRSDLERMREWLLNHLPREKR